MKNSGKILVVLLATTTLAGCGTLRGATDALNERPRQAYRSPNLQAAENLMPVVNDMGYALAIMDLSACTVTQPEAPVPGRRRSAPTVTCQPFVQTGVTSSDLDDFLNASIFVIDANCTAYLDSLSNLGDTSRWTRSQFNTVSNYIGVLMALAGQPTEDLGYLNAATGFFNASADNLESFVLVSPTPGKLTPLVKTAQNELRQDLDEIRVGDARLRWSNTARWIEEYAALCTPRGIRSLLDAAIDSTSTGGTGAELISFADRVAPGVVETLQGLGAFRTLLPEVRGLRSSAQLGAMTWRIQDDGLLTEEQKSRITSSLGSGVSAALDTALQDPAQTRVLRQMIGGANSGLFTELRRSQEAEWATASAITRAERLQTELNKAREDLAAMTERAEAAVRDAQPAGGSQQPAQ
jgi:hypothetical protein